MSIFGNACRLTICRATFLTFVASLVSAGVTQATVPFGGNVSIPTSISRGEAVVTADFDGDGDLDVAGIGGSYVVYALNGGGGTSWTAADLRTNAPRPRQLAVGDLDGDDDPDLIYTDWDDNRAYWYANEFSSGGTFSGRRNLAGVSRADGVAVGDLDGDGDLDVVVTSRQGDDYFWVENVNGNASGWSRHLIADRLDGAQYVAIGDIDGDGDPDVVGGGAEDFGSLVWLENSAGDASAWSVNTIDATGWIQSVAITDLDLDGDLDVVAQENNNDPPASTEDVTIWWQNTSGDGSSWSEHLIGGAGADVTRGTRVVDLDLDGDPDVLASREGDWFENSAGDASTWTRRSYSDNGDIVDAFLGDMDGDGDLDVTTARFDNGGLRWWPNETCSLADADADSDGFRDSCDVCSGFDDALDADGDGVPDGCDLCPGEDDRVNQDGLGGPDACQAVGSLSIDDVVMSEGDVGLTQITFSVTLTGALPVPLAVDYTTRDATATAADGDYLAMTGTLVFAGTDGEVQTFTIAVAGDQEFESDEQFTVELGESSTPYAVVADGLGWATIANDDAVLLSVADASIAEGDAGAALLMFDVGVSGARGEAFSVAYATTDGTAVAGSDYVMNTGALNFTGADGETRTVTVLVAGDEVVEGDEILTLTLGTATLSDVAFADAIGVGTISNDDAATLTVSGVSALEGTGGANSAFDFNVVLSHSVQGGVQVEVSTLAASALAGSDFTPLTQTLVFDGSVAEVETFTVTVESDDLLEDDESFFVELDLPSVAGVTVVGSPATGAVLNDDEALLSIGDVTLAEGNSGTSQATFTVLLTGGVEASFDAAVATQAGTAAADEDFTSSNAILSFGGFDGESHALAVDVLGDVSLEPTETFTVTLGAPTDPRVQRARTEAVGTIVNDDSASIAIDDVSAVEGDAGTSDFTFTLSLAGAVQDGFTVPVAAQDGTATTAGSDFAPSTLLVSFDGTAGETQSFTVPVFGDLVVEPTESFLVVVGEPSNGNVSVLDGSGVGTISNDDAAAVSISDFVGSEGDAASSTFLFDVALDAPTSEAFSVSYQTRDGSATVAGDDYDSTSGVLMFTGDSAEVQSVEVVVFGDVVDEEHETFFVDLTSTSTPDVTISNGVGEGTIVDDDVLLEVSVEGEGNVTSLPAGIDCGDGATDCSELFSLDDLIELTATPAATGGWVFDRWSGDVDCSDGSVTLTDGTSCTATFLIPQGELEISFEGLGFATVTSDPAGIDCDPDTQLACDAVFGIGLPIDLLVDAAAGVTFGGWTGDADCSDGTVEFTTNDQLISCVAQLGETPLFADGFESGDTGSWAARAPGGSAPSGNASADADTRPRDRRASAAVRDHTAARASGDRGEIQ